MSQLSPSLNGKRPLSDSPKNPLPNFLNPTTPKSTLKALLLLISVSLLQSVLEHEARVKASSEELSVQQRELSEERDRIATDTQRLTHWEKTLTAKQEVSATWLTLYISIIFRTGKESIDGCLGFSLYPQKMTENVATDTQRLTQWEKALTAKQEVRAPRSTHLRFSLESEIIVVM
jgi:hypothetical protein